MSELVHIPFHGGEVLTVDVDGKPWVVLRPAFAAMGLQADSQIAKIRAQDWSTTRVTEVVGGDGKARVMVIADVRTFLMALAMIPASRVSEEARPLLVAYQKEVADVIEAHFTKAAARKTEAPESYAPRTLTLDETCALLEQRYGLSYSTVSLARALRTCGVFKQNGAPRKEFRWWFWFTGSTWNVHPHVVVAMARRLDNAEEQLRAFDGIQLRLEAEGVGSQQELAPP